MKFINFPPQYKKAILKKIKNTTLRIKNERGKYKAGKIYLAQSYAGNSWNQKIKIAQIIKTTINQLSKYNIPAKSIRAIAKSAKISAKEPVEIIRFNYIN